jgi:hypothetical protein
MSATLPQPQQKELPTIILITVWVINNQSSTYFVKNTGEKLLNTNFMKNPPNLNKL